MKKQEMKKNQILNMVKSALLDLPSPSSISFLWNMGFMLGLTLSFQIITGLLLSMLYTSDMNTAFENMVMIMRDSKMGWISRLLHMNGASLFFIFLYIHTSRGIYFSSAANQKKTWFSGTILLLMVMMTAFLGYVLPWGQMSFWGAAVITGVISSIPFVGNDILTWIWGGPSVSNPTLNRFFSLHFIMPIVILGLVLVHLIFLHSKGSSNPSNSQTNLDKVKFNPIFTLKDIVPLIATMVGMIFLLSNFPNILGDVENFNMANPLNAPIHIQPEWYFLFAYVILRSIPSKLGGVVALVFSVISILIFLLKKGKSTKFNVTKKLKFWFLVSVFLILTWIGSKTVESPFETVGKFYMIFYFLSIIMM